MMIIGDLGIELDYNKQGIHTYYYKNIPYYLGKWIETTFITDKKEFDESELGKIFNNNDKLITGKNGTRIKKRNVVFAYILGL